MVVKIAFESTGRTGRKGTIENKLCGFPGNFEMQTSRQQMRHELKFWFTVGRPKAKKSFIC